MTVRTNPRTIFPEEAEVALFGPLLGAICIVDGLLDHLALRRLLRQVKGRQDEAPVRESGVTRPPDLRARHTLHSVRTDLLS